MMSVEKKNPKKLAENPTQGHVVETEQVVGAV